MITIGVASITQVTHVRNKIVTFKGGHLIMSIKCDKNDLPYYKELLKKDRIRSLSLPLGAISFL